MSDWRFPAVGRIVYPPEPWSLRGRLRVAVWLLPVRSVPAIPPELLTSVRVVRIGGWAVMGAAWVEYAPGGVLHYNELLAAVLTRAGLRPRVTITHIWVDNVASRDGGRALWGIPKDLARFDFTADGAQAETDDGVLAEATLSRGSALPGRWPIGFRVVQSLGGQAKTSPVRAKARVRLGRSRWTIPPGSPLAFLSQRRPLLTATAEDFDMSFGATIGS
jgi:hypothetical protein